MSEPERVTPSIVTIRAVHLSDGTKWPLPEPDSEHSSAAWVARYDPSRLTADQAMYLAGVSNAYDALVNQRPNRAREIVQAVHEAIVARDIRLQIGEEVGRG